MAKKPKAKPEVIAPINTGATLIQNYAGYGATPVTAPVDELAPYRQSLIQNYAGLGGSGQAGGGGTPVVAEDVVEVVPEKPKVVPDRTISNKKINADGSVTLIYSDGTEEVVGGPNSIPKEKNRSAFDLITLELKRNGLESLVVPLTRIFQEGIDDADTLRLRLNDTPEYKARFSANATRVANGLRALSPAEYTQLEDQYQEVMRNYGLPAKYWTKDDTGKQSGFDQLLAGDVSAVELEDRVATAKNRVMNASTEIKDALKTYYGDTIKDGDILAYVLDPKQALNDIKRKVTTAEIGGAALQSGLATNLARAEELGRYGVDKAMAEKGYSTIGAGLQRGSQLASIYGEDPYTQTTAEQEIFNVPGAEEARKKRQKITGLEKAAFGGQTGITAGALARDRAGAY